MMTTKFLLFLSLPLLLQAEISSHARTLQRKGILDNLRSKKVDPKTERMTDDELVDYVNSHQSYWKAVKSDRFSSYNQSTRTGIMGVQNIYLPTETKRRLSTTRHLNVTIPDKFDSREWWSECQSIGKVKDQSLCGSCWAFGAAEAITDRVCIASKGKITPNISVDDVLACCTACGEGCNGGWPIKAWDYWVKEGLVTGGDYGSNDSCLPYPFPSCKHPIDNSTADICKHGLFHTPQCKKTCNNNYTKEFEADKHFGLSAYGVENSVEAIQKELMTYGPVEVAFEVYDDFFHYSEGVYVHTAGSLAGGHAVKLIGWGEEKGLPYWLLVNSWNSDWGEKGLFKIVRGSNECGIESGVVAGIPKTY